MQTQEFLDAVTDRPGVESNEKAREITEATLQTLGELIDPHLREKWAEQLPDELAEDLVSHEEEAQGLSISEFQELVAKRADVSERRVLIHIRGVFEVLVENLPETDIGAALEELPDEYVLLFEPGEYLQEHEFLDAVRQRADLEDRAEARTVVHAVFQTTGERLTRGETEQLATYLPPELDDWLVDWEMDDARDLSVHAFAEEVMIRASLDDEGTAKEYTRAVLEVLYRVSSESEFERAADQLPQEYSELFPVETGA